MLTTWTHDTVIARDDARPWSGLVTAARKRFAEVKATGRVPYLIPLAAGYFMVGAAETRDDAKRLAAAAKARDAERRKEVRDLVEGWEAEDVARATGV